MIKTRKAKNRSFNRRKLSLPGALKYAGIVIGAVILVCILLFIIDPDPFLNAFLKDRITKTLNEAYPAYSIKLGKMHYNLWKNRLGLDSVTLKSSDSAVTYSAVSISIGGIDWMKILRQKNILLIHLQAR